MLFGPFWCQLRIRGQAELVHHKLRSSYRISEVETEMGDEECVDLRGWTVTNIRYVRLLSTDLMENFASKVDECCPLDVRNPALPETSHSALLEDCREGVEETVHSENNRRPVNYR